MQELCHSANAKAFLRAYLLATLVAEMMVDGEYSIGNHYLLSH
jgi:hypothetical protein